MTIQTRQISVTISEPDGTPVEGATVDIKLHGLGNGTGGAVAPTLQTELTDDTGYCVFTLWQNEADYSDTHYTISSRHPVTGEMIHRNEMFVVGGADVDVKTLLNLASTGDAAAIAAGAAAGAAAGTDSGAIAGVSAMAVMIKESVVVAVTTMLSNTPASSPLLYSFHVVGTSPTGAWAGHAKNLAWHNGSAWQFIAPHTGTAVLTQGGVRYIYTSGNWTATPLPASQISGLDAALTRLAAMEDGATSNPDAASIPDFNAAVAAIPVKVKLVSFSSTTVVPVLDNEDHVLKCTNASAVTVRIDKDVFEDGAQLTLLQGGAGQVTLTGGTNVTIIPPKDSNAKTRGQNCLMQAYKESSGTPEIWRLFGDVEAT